MSHHNTVFSQFLKLVPRHEFERLVKEHHSGRSLRAISRWDQFVALTMGQLAGRQSLRDVIANLSAQATRLYHLGCRTIARSTLARVNQNHSYKLYESLFENKFSSKSCLFTFTFHSLLDFLVVSPPD